MADSWDDRAYLRGTQYKTDTNLAARQSIYAYQQPRLDLAARVLDLAGPAPSDTIADVGCGNGNVPGGTGPDRGLHALTAGRAAWRRRRRAGRDRGGCAPQDPRRPLRNHRPHRLPHLPRRLAIPAPSPQLRA
jgi:hypothetical protein